VLSHYLMAAFLAAFSFVGQFLPVLL
jgi:hypothetical protein